MRRCGYELNVGRNFFSHILLCQTLANNGRYFFVEFALSNFIKLGLTVALLSSKRGRVPDTNGKLNTLAPFLLKFFFSLQVWFALIFSLTVAFFARFRMFPIRKI